MYAFVNKYVSKLFLKTAREGAVFMVTGRALYRCWSLHLNCLGTVFWDRNWVRYNGAILWRALYVKHNSLNSIYSCMATINITIFTQIIHIHKKHLLAQNRTLWNTNLEIFNIRRWTINDHLVSICEVGWTSLEHVGLDTIFLNFIDKSFVSHFIKGFCSI